ncbi:MAG: molybdopterin-dependent oxidoreductase, partial [Actinomycetota bacterium]
MTATDDAPTRTAIRTCPLCEAGCGLEITVRRDDDGVERVQRIRGDRDDVFSGGFICPKGSTLKQLHEDPDRLRAPMVKRDGVHVEVTWDEAWAEVARRFGDYLERHDRTTLAAYVGNPTVHSLSGQTFSRVLLTGLGTRQRFSASTVDQMPRHVAAGAVFGSPVAIPVPDLDRTDYLLMLGANPYASNGSVCTAPDFPGRVAAIRERGGTVVVVDPRRSKTAEEADEWLAIRPATDALLLAAIAEHLLSSGRAAPGEHLAGHVAGHDALAPALAPFTPDAVAAATGIDAATTRRIAEELAAAPSAAVYGRIGTTTTEFGSTASWLIDVVNYLTGNLDRPGGSMFTTPVTGGPTTNGRPGVGRGFTTGRGHSRVSGHPEVMGEYPVAALAEEITTAGQGQVRGLITFAGNPVLSTPNSEQLRDALDDLELMVSIDIYLNETTRYADVILPPPSQLERPHYDISLLQFAVRNVANYSPAVFERPDEHPDEWEIIAKLTAIVQGVGGDDGTEADPDAVDELVVRSLLDAATKSEQSVVHGRDAGELFDELSASGRRGPERILDAMLRTGPYGDGFGADADGTSLDDLIERPHGRDFGPLQPRVPDVLRTPTGQIEIAPALFVDDLARLADSLDAPDADELLLVGRRHLRSNNSWMHNVKVLVKGKARGTLQVHPDDADRLGVADGG